MRRNIGGDGGETVQRLAPATPLLAREAGEARDRVATFTDGRPSGADLGRKPDDVLVLLSHELRSPLSALRLAVQSLRRGTTAITESQRQQLHALVERQVTRMTRIVDNFLVLARSGQGRMHLDRERVDLRVVLSHAAETVGGDIQARHHCFVVVLPEGPMWLQGDPGLLEQVFVNLLANASKYTPAGGELRMWAHVSQGTAVVRIRDSGIGIAADALPRIFDRYTQANESAQSSQSGLGIGLALVRSLVQLHGGSVSAASAGPGQGSEFAVRLPQSGSWSGP